MASWCSRYSHDLERELKYKHGHMIRLVNMSYCDILKCSTSSIETLTFGCITWHAPHSFQAHQLKKLKSRSLGEKQSNCLSRQCSSRKRPGKVGLRHHRGLVLWEEQKEKQKKVVQQPCGSPPGNLQRFPVENHTSLFICSKQNHIRNHLSNPVNMQEVLSWSEFHNSASHYEEAWAALLSLTLSSLLPCVAVEKAHPRKQRRASTDRTLTQYRNDASHKWLLWRLKWWKTCYHILLQQSF